MDGEECEKYDERREGVMKLRERRGPDWWMLIVAENAKAVKGHVEGEV